MGAGDLGSGPTRHNHCVSTGLVGGVAEFAIARRPELEDVSGLQMVSFGSVNEGEFTV